VACAVVDGIAQTVLVAGAVTGVTLLISQDGAVASAGWVVALAAVGFTGAALWAALCGDREPGTVPATGWWTTVLLLTTSVAATWGELFVRLLVVLAVLGLLGLGLTSLANPGSTGPTHERSAVGRRSPGVRRPDRA
jgi:hypothetical protein